MAFTLAAVMALHKNGKEKFSAKEWNRALGRRLAHFRKMRGFSQREMARRIGAVQVVVSDYEVGKLRVSAEMALRFAAALEVPIQELLQISKPLPVETPRKPNRRVLQRLERIERLPRRKQEALLTTIDAFLQNTADRAS
jgi:transcriptional regulator with XRE-family HTH domain